jgi:hypothetical protein
MTEPAVTNVYQLPRQIAGQSSRVRFNQMTDMVDNALATLAQAIATVDLQVPMVKPLGPFIMVADQLLVDLGIDLRVGSILDVRRGGFEHTLGIDWSQPDVRHILFAAPSHQGEVVNIIEYQMGPDAAPPPTVPAGPLYRVYKELLQGLINSTNGTDGNGRFTLLHTIAAGTVPAVQIAGFIDLVPNVHYTWAANYIDILPGNHPVPGETITSDYEWRY